MGVWIEIIFSGTTSDQAKRRSLCGSVDWNLAKRLNFQSRIVAPFVGVWIEIFVFVVSLPWSKVAPFVGVWIEIPDHHICPRIFRVAPFVGVWIEINCNMYFLTMKDRRSLCGSVDWNHRYQFLSITVFCRSLCGSVDWNLGNATSENNPYLSLPLWECGLK